MATLFQPSAGLKWPAHGALSTSSQTRAVRCRASPAYPILPGRTRTSGKASGKPVRPPPALQNQNSAALCTSSTRRPTSRSALSLLIDEVRSQRTLFTAGATSPIADQRRHPYGSVTTSLGGASSRADSSHPELSEACLPHAGPAGRGQASLFALPPLHRDAQRLFGHTSACAR
jgi:hypothetical protein